jgi:hypothetical protein
MTLLGEAPDVVLQGFPLLLLTTLQISWIAGPHLRALEVAGKDLLEIFLAIDRVPWQVIEPSSGCINQVYGEELDDEKVIVGPACPACEATVL